MKVVVYRPGGGLGHHRLQLQKLRLGDGPDAFEVLQQGLFPDVSHPWDAVQPGGQGGFCVLLVVIGDGEAVDLLLDLAHQGEQRGLCWMPSSWPSAVTSARVR